MRLTAEEGSGLTNGIKPATEIVGDIIAEAGQAIARRLSRRTRAIQPMRRDSGTLNSRAVCSSVERGSVIPAMLSYAPLVFDKSLLACYKKAVWFAFSGPVAQLGARMTGSHEVVGSIPTRSTNLTFLICDS